MGFRQEQGADGSSDREAGEYQDWDGSVDLAKLSGTRRGEHCADASLELRKENVS